MSTASSPSPGRLIYFVHDATDVAYARRIQMLRSAGVAVTALGFTRGDKAPATIGSVPFECIGRTQAANFIARIRTVLKALMSSGQWASQMASADAVLARNLETLALAVHARRQMGASVPIHYEVLDIHRLMLRKDVVGQALRSIERRLMRHCASLLVSSPAFASEYFDKWQPGHPPVRLVENKVLAAPASPDGAHRAHQTVDGKLRIGWFGIIRCRKSLLMLRELARRSPERIEVHIRGRVADTAIPDFSELLADTPNLRFHGPYKNPDDLARIYAEVDLTWAVDLYEEGMNSLWLLPNRIYEGCLHGSVPIALRGNQTSRWLEERGIGLRFETFSLEALSEVTDRIDSDRLDRLRRELQAVGRSHFECSADESLQLAHHLLTPARVRP